MTQNAKLESEDFASAKGNALAELETVKRRAIWLASYPKSGNTWVRVFLHNLIRKLRGDEDAQDINRLHEWTGRESLKANFAARLGKPPEEATLAEIAAARPLAQADILRAHAKPALLKTHNAVANVEGHSTINLEATLAAVYIVRNPLDVAVSYARHLAQPLDRMIEFMADPQAMNGASERHVYEFMGSWSFHVASWMSLAHRPVLILRYEDLLAAPERAFGRFASYLGLRPSAAQLRAAIENSSFAKLARQEEEAGFVERPAQSEKFFRGGRAGAWRTALSHEQAAAIIAAHAPMMQRMGYLAESCGASL